MATATQKNRRLAVETPLGEDVLLLTSFTGSEVLSDLYTFHLEMISEKDFIDPKQIIGKNISFSIKLADNESERKFNGFVSRFHAGGKYGTMRRYSADVVPWLWFLTQTSDCRVFQGKTVPEIVEQVFSEQGFKDFETGEIKGNHPKLEYCVQYRETDFQFVSRLLESEGIFYFFRHEPKRNVMVLADQKNVHQFCPEKKVELEITHTSILAFDRVTHWSRDFAFIPGKWAQTDNNFMTHPARTTATPAKLLLTSEASVIPIGGNDKFEMFDYTGNYDDTGAGAAYTKARMEVEETRHDVASGSSTCKTFFAGGKFEFSKHDCAAEVGKIYVLTSVQHGAVEPADYTTGGAAQFEYSNSFYCIPEAVTFRPTRKTPKPMMYGTQTAVVTGPPGEEIWPDKYGRVKVQFYWDRLQKRDEKTSCWVRCAQSIAGKGWGAMVLPRVGQEVVVSYLEGNPDRPLITGVVYNDDQMPPYSLPDEKTKTTFKSNSTPGGEGFNEFRFEDKKGKEQVFLHGERNLDIRVKNEAMTSILSNSHRTVGYDKKGSHYDKVEGEQHLHVLGIQAEQIDGNYFLMVGHGENGDGGNHDIMIEKEKCETVGEDSNLTVGGNRNEQVGGTLSQTAGEHQVKIDQKYCVDAGTEIHLKSGVKVVIEATQISLVSGGNFIDIGPAGVSIMGSLVNINSGGSPASGSGATPTAPKAAIGVVPKDPTPADNAKTGKKSMPDSLS